ncbi:MAG: hypothetical protein ACLU9S_05030 [Oscillospiraceae bacterium]
MDMPQSGFFCWIDVSEFWGTPTEITDYTSSAKPEWPSTTAKITVPRAMAACASSTAAWAAT